MGWRGCIPNDDDATTLLLPSGGDDSPALSKAVAAGGKILLAPGNFNFNSSPTGTLSAGLISRNTPTSITGSGRGITNINLSAACPQFLGFNKIADGDTFTEVSVADLTVNGQNNTSAVHNMAAVIGTGPGTGGILTNINLNEITVERVDTLQVPTAFSLGIGNVSLVVSVPAVGGAQYNITGITVRDVNFQGGQFGITVNGQGPSSTGPGTNGTNVFIDHVLIENWQHDTLTTPTGAGFPSANVQLVSFGFGGTDLVVGKGKGHNSFDVGIEIDAAQECTISDVVIEDSWNASFFQTNYRDPPIPAAQRITFTRCRGRRILSTNPYPSFAFENHANNTPLGTLIYDGCSHYSNKTAMLGAGIGEAIGPSPTALPILLALICNDLKVTMLGMNDSAASGSSEADGVYIGLATAPAVVPRVSFNNTEITIVGQKTGADTDLILSLRFDGAMILDIDQVIHDITWTGIQNNGIRGIEVGRNTSTISGKINRVAWRNMSGDGAPLGVVIRSTATLTIPSKLTVADYDGGLLIANANVFSLTAPAQPNLQFVRIRWPAPPRGGVAPPAFPATTVAATNTTGHTVLATVTNGTGAITQVSIDGAGTGLQVAANGTFMVPLPPGASIAFTYASGAPSWLWVIEDDL